MKTPNTLLEDAINKMTYLLTIAGASKKSTSLLSSNTDCSPLWITGLFRSGTSITTRIIGELGFSLGPDNHLLKGKGKRRSLNPDGFFENHLFMEWSLYLFNLLDCWGDLPPNKNNVEKFDYAQINYKDFVYNAIVNIHDDRVSNLTKLQLFRKYHPQNLDNYITQSFSYNPAVKNPHFMLLQPILDKFWPEGRFLVVFRNPTDTINSAQEISPRAQIELYKTYYERMMDHKDALFFDYDTLIEHPKKSIALLAQSLDVASYNDSIYRLVRSKKNPARSIAVPIEINEIHLLLKTKALNN